MESVRHARYKCIIKRGSKGSNRSPMTSADSLLLYLYTDTWRFSTAHGVDGVAVKDVLEHLLSNVYMTE